MDNEIRDRIILLLKSDDNELRELAVALFRSQKPRSWMEVHWVVKGLTQEQADKALLELKKMMQSIK
jgi:hypothetical protein